MPVSMTSTAPSTIRLRWERTDGHRRFTLITSALGLALVAAAAAMAMVGLPPIDLHGLPHKFGIMDPLCGGTRAARYTAQGDLAQAWRYNPLGIIAVAGAVLVVARTTIGVTARRWVNLDLQVTPRARRLGLAVLFVLIALLEVRQQMRAELLMEGTFVPWA